MPKCEKGAYVLTWCGTLPMSIRVIHRPCALDSYGSRGNAELIYWWYRAVTTLLIDDRVLEGRRDKLRPMPRSV